MSLAKKRNGKATAKKLFIFALDIVSSGQASELSNSNEFDARIFLPKIPAGLAKAIPFAQIVDRFDRLAGMNKRADELIAIATPASELHNELQHFWQTGTILPPKKVARVSLPDADSKNRIKHEVKFCGEIIWPRDSLKHVTYDDLNAGWHLVHHWLMHLENATPQKPKEVAVAVRHLIWDIKEASSISGLIDVMLTCMAAYSRHNESKAQADLSGCIPPGSPR